MEFTATGQFRNKFAWLNCLPANGFNKAWIFLILNKRQHVYWIWSLDGSSENESGTGVSLETMELEISEVVFATCVTNWQGIINPMTFLNWNGIECWLFLFHIWKRQRNTSIWASSLLVEIIFSVMLIHEIALCSIFIMPFLLCLTTTLILHIFSVTDLNGLAQYFQSPFFSFQKLN